MSIYVSPRVTGQLIADTSEELGKMCRVIGCNPWRLSPWERALAVNLGAIELSRREFVQKLDEIQAFGRGFGARREQIMR